MENSLEKNGRKNINLNFRMDGVPYMVAVKQDYMNDEKRFLISINGGPEHLFVWDPELVGLRSLNDEAVTLPDGLETEISDRLVKTVVFE